MTLFDRDRESTCAWNCVLSYPHDGRCQSASRVRASADAVVATLIREVPRYRVPVGVEARLQAALRDRVFPAVLPGETVVPEFALGPEDRIDFWLPRVGVGLEVKVQGSSMAVARQLLRYVAHRDVRHLVLITTRVRLTSLTRVWREATPLTVIPFVEAHL